MMADNNKFPAYDKNLKANHFPLFGIATKVLVDNEKSTSMAHFLQVENLIKKIHKNNYDEQQTIFLDDKKFPYFYYQKNKQSKKFPISKEEIKKKPQKICNKFPLYVKEDKKFPLVGKMYNDDINLNENMSTIFMCKIPQIITTTTITIRKMSTNLNNNNFDKQKFPLKNFQHENYKFQFPLNSKDKFMTSSILYVEEMIKIEERAEQDQVHMAMYNNNEKYNEIQKFNEQQNKKIPKEKNVAINKHNNNNNNNIIVEEKQLEQTTKIIMLEAFSKNEQTTTTTIDEIEHFENNRGKQINEKSNNNNNNNNENLLNICYLINKQTETAKNVEKINFEFEKNFSETSSDVCEQSTQEDRPQFNIIFNNNNNNQQEEDEEKATKSNNEINLNLNVMGLTNFSHEGSVLSEKELLIDSSIDLGADMKHDQLNASNNENMPVQKHNYADLNKTSFTTYPRAKQTTDFARKYLPNLLDDQTSPTTTTTNEPTCSSLRKSSTSVDVTSVLPERTLLRRQRRSLTQKSKSEQEEDPVERLNRLRARISGALCQVKGVLKQYSTDNVEEAAENCSSIPAAVPAKQEQEKSNETDNGPINFRFVRKIRRRSSFDERVVLEVTKESTEKETKEEGSSENETKIETIQDRSEEKIQPLTLDLIDEIKAKPLVGNEEKLNENETKNKKLDENETKLKENETRVNESETNIRKLEENETKVKKLNENEVKNKKLDQNETKFIENENTIKKLDKNDQNLKKLDDNETKLIENETNVKKLNENEVKNKKLDENETKFKENETRVNESETNIRKLEENETKVKKLNENEVEELRF